MAGRRPHLQTEAEYRYRQPLHRAIAGGSLQALQQLLTTPVDVNQSEHERTPLMLAASYDNLEMIEALLAARVDVNATNSHNWSALNLAAMRGCSRAVELLIDHGADKSNEAKVSRPSDIERRTRHRPTSVSNRSRMIVYGRVATVQVYSMWNTG